MNVTERRYSAQIGAPGIAIGTLVRGSTAVRLNRRSDTGSVDCERQRLKWAVCQAIHELRSLVADHGNPAAAILDFQVEALVDRTLLDEAETAIAGGADADTAWWTCLARHISDHQRSSHVSFRIHTTDYVDLRDRVIRILAGDHVSRVELPDNAIVIDTDMTPTRFLNLDRTRLAGIALVAGSPASHTAVLARAWGVPMLCEFGGHVAWADTGIVDAHVGLLIVDPSARTRRDYVRRWHGERRTKSRAKAAMAREACTRDGQRIEITVNVDDPNTLDDNVVRSVSGAGLVRTESMFHDCHAFPDEQAQYERYAALLARFGTGFCRFRTFDVGGDKGMPGLALPVERNPFLGMRGIRQCLDAPTLIMPQIRALLRLAVDDRVEVLLPMVTVCEEYRQARALFEQALASLRADDIPAAMPSLGIMVETPAAAVAIDTFDADFFCIGSNDLTQYTMAAARDGAGRLAELNDAGHVAVLRLIERVVRHGEQSGRGVSLCGDITAKPAVLGRLLATGLRHLSVAPAIYGHVKQCVRQLDLRDWNDAIHHA